MKFCPVCGSPDLIYSVLGTTAQVYYCKLCGYRGVFVIEDSTIAEKIREEWEKGKRIKAEKQYKNHGERS